MTPKLVRYTDHALAQMRERVISRSDVRWLLAQGLPFEPVQWPGGEHRLGKRGNVGRRELGVVYLEGQAAILVLTAMEME